jgi:CRISPR-associated endonuclease/helicase Cas3
VNELPTFDEFFAALWTVDPAMPARPFPWQRRLAESVRDSGWPRAIALPTGAGKTSVIDVWTWALAADAMRGKGRRQPRRLFFVIDRRIVVDSVFEHARAIAHALEQREPEPLATAASALLALGGDVPLLAARLRGGLELDRAWAESIEQPLVCASTVDQVGSRLLFRGYGLPRRSRNPLAIHAALVGNDALLVIDEAHLSAPFDATVDTVERLRARSEHELARPWHCLRMTATPRPHSGPTFTLNVEDESDGRLGRRLRAQKSAQLVEVRARRSRDAVADAAAEAACALLEDEHLRTIGVVVNRVARARAIADNLRSRSLDADVLLLIGPSRPADREQVIADAMPRVRAGRERSNNSRRLVVVATQTIEVGADLDFDALVTECAASDSLRQRFGRLDRLGELDGGGRAVILYAEARDEDPIYGSALPATWEWLQSQASDGIVDVGPRSLANPPAETLSPVVHAPLLFPAYLDRLVQTSPLPSPDPAVSVFLHGFESRPPDVEIVWRADLDSSRPDRWRDIVALVPPSGREAVRVGFLAARRWLSDLPAVDLADLEGGADEQLRDELTSGYRALRWRGARDAASKPIGAVDLRPGDTIVVPASHGGCDSDGWTPESESPVRDLLERVAPKDAPLLRLHRRVLEQACVEAVLPQDLFVPNPDDAGLLVPDPAAIQRGLEELARSDSSLGLVAQTLLAGPHTLIPYPHEEGVLVTATDDAPVLGDDDGELGGGAVSLRDHQERVTRETSRIASALGLEDRVARTLTAAASHHDEGKRDPRFQKLLSGGSAVPAGEPLAKSRTRVRDRRARERALRESGLPSGFRHEAASVALIDGMLADVDTDLVRQLIASHHGCARPYFPPTDDPNPWVDVSDLERPDGETPERFWRLVRRYGWWTLAYLEAVLRLADHRASAQERAS